MESAGGTKLKLGLANQSRNPLLFNRQTLSQAHQHLPSSSLTSLGGSVAQSLKGSTVSSGSRFHFLKDSSYFNKESEKSSPQQQRPYDATTNGGGYTALRLSAAAAVGSRSNTTTTTSSPMLASSSHFANLTNSTISANHSNPNSTATSQESLLNRKKTTTKKRFSLLSSSSSDLVVGASADAGGPTNLGGSGTISSLSSSGATSSAASSAASSSAASLDLILENHELLEWIEGQLESRGIDSVVYGRYILSLLHLSTDSLSESSSSGSGGANCAEDQDSGYGGNSSRRATLTGKSLATGNLASSTSTSASRYCDFHQHLYPGLNLHSSRTKLLPQAASGGSKSLNTQKPASTTKFMHRRYQNGAVGSGGGGGRGSSPISELLTTADYDDYTATSRHCPDCAARNNYDYRKVVLTDCLKDAIDQVRAFHAGDDTDDDEKGKAESWTGRGAGDSGRGDALARQRQVPDSKCGNIDSFVDELVSKFDRFRCSSQKQVSEPTTPAAISNNLTNHGASRYQVSNGFGPMADPNSTMDAFNPAFSGASSRRPFTKPFTSTVGNVNVATSKTTSSSSGSLYGHNNPNANHTSSNHKAFQHSRSFEQNAAAVSSSAVGDSTDSVPWPRLSDSGSVQVNGSLSGSNSRSNSSVRATAYQQSKLYHRSLSDDTAGAKGEDAKELSTTTSTTTTNSTASSASASATPRDQALKYFAAFPALSGKFPGNRSVSSTQATLSSLTSPKSTASAKISAQSSLDDSVFSEDGSPASGGEQTASWNGLKIIKNISKSNVVSSMAASAAETVSLSNGGALSSVGGVTTKPPTLSGKARVIVAAAPSSLLLDSSRDSSNFTTLKKKGSNSGSVSSSGASLSSAGPLRKSSSTTSTSSLEAEEAQKRSMTMPSSALAIVSTGRVATREQEKIFNIMPSFLNPLRGRESDRAAASSNSSTSKASMSLATSSVSVSSRKPPAASTAIASINSNGSSTSTSTANGPKLSDSNWSRGVSSSSSAFASATSSTTTLGQTQARTGRLRSVRPFAGGVDWTATGSATATTAVQSSSGPITSTQSLHSSMAVDGVASSTCTSSGSTSSTISSAAVVDLLPSFLKSHSVSSGCGGGPSHTVASAFVASKQSNSSSSSAALSQLEESLPWTRSACHSTTTTTFNSGDATAAYSQAAEHSLAAATIYGSTSSVAYQHKPPREVIRSAPTATSTTTTTSASLRSETASAAHWHLHQHHQKQQQQQQQYEPPGKPDWKTTGAYSAYTSLSANPSAASNSSGAGCLTPKTIARAALGEPTALSGPTSSTLYASQSSNSRMIAPPPPPPYQNTVSQYRRFSPTPPPLTTTTSTTTAAAVTASTAALSAVDSSRLLNDYWFNFTNNKGEVTTTTDRTETESVEESRNRPDEATGSLRHHRTTAAAAAAGMMSISTNCLKGDVPYQTDNQHRTQMLNGAYNNTSGGEKDSAPRSAPSESSHQRSLVIDSKGALDEWMNSIREQQIARRLNAQVNSHNKAQFVPQTQPQAQPQPHQQHHQQPQPQSAHRPPSGKSASSASPPLSVSEPKDATSGSLQGFLDSIMQSSTGPDPMASSPGLTCWRPLSSMYRTEDAAGLTDCTSNSKVDFVSYYWNQNCTLGYMDLLDDARTAANQIAAAGGGVVCESVGAKSPKSFQQFLDEQAAYRTEISLLSDLFHKSQRRPMATARTGPSTSFESLLSPGTDCLSSAAADPRISLANHESESSAFQEVPSLASQNDLLLLLHDWTQGSDHSKVSSSACQQDSHPDAPQTSYFQPIEPEQLTTSGAGELQTELEWTSFQLLQQQQQQETASDSQVKSTRPMAAASSRATTDSSSTVSRSLSASRAELDAYFTPELSTCSNVATSSCPGLTTGGTTTTTFYSSAGVPTSGSETELTQALVAPCTSTVLLPSERAVFPEKLSNSSCACNNSCNGHFIQTACCCYPDEYHCRLGLESPPEARMCDKSTTTTDQLLDAVNATLGTLFNHCAHHQQTPPPPNGSSCTTANNRCTTMNLFDMNDQQLADSFLASGGNFPLNGTLAATTTATSSFAHHPDEDEFNVTDLVNDVLRLHVAEQSNASGLNGTHLNVSSAEVNVESLPAAAAATGNANALQDDFDGPPMPYSKRKKFQNAKEGKVYGQFPLSCAEMHQLRLMTQNKMSTATSSYYQRKPASATRGGATRTKAGAAHLQSTVTSASSANSSAIGTTVYYSNRSSVFSAFDATNSLLDSSPPSGETASQYTEQEGTLALGSFEDGSYGTGEDGAGYYENDSFPEENGYILGPDGAEFYVPGESGGDSGERGGLSLSPEQLQLYAQYGADPFRVMNPDEGSPKDSVSSLFDLTFKTNNRTIDNTIDTVSKQSQKPCSFFMEGFCARGDCKFSHDLSSITCKYWMEGFCIREGSCPFLHGYANDGGQTSPPAVEQSKLDPNAKSFQFKIFDFPALDDEGRLGAFAGIDLGAEPVPLSVSLDTASMCQAIFNSNSSNHRVNFNFKSSSAKSAKGKQLPMGGGGGINGKTGAEQNANTSSPGEEEWPSLNGGGDSGANGFSQPMTVTGYKQAQADSSLSGGSYTDSLTFREKAVKAKKGGKYRSPGVGGGSSSGAATSASAQSNSSGSKGFAGVSLKGFL